MDQLTEMLLLSEMMAESGAGHKPPTPPDDRQAETARLLREMAAKLKHLDVVAEQMQDLKGLSAQVLALADLQKMR